MKSEKWETPRKPRLRLWQKAAGDEPEFGAAGPVAGGLGRVRAQAEAVTAGAVDVELALRSARKASVLPSAKEPGSSLAWAMNVGGVFGPMWISGFSSVRELSARIFHG